MRDYYAAAEALQLARDQLVIARNDEVNRNYHLKRSIENIKDAMKALGIRRPSKNGHDR